MTENHMDETYVDLSGKVHKVKHSVIDSGEMTDEKERRIIKELCEIFGKSFFDGKG